VAIQWRHSIQQMSAYVPSESIEKLKRDFGLSDVIKLASNENPLGTSPRALSAMQRELVNAYAYPDARPDTLYERLGEIHGIGSDALIVGNGADNVISIIGSAYINPGDEVLYCAPTFSSYQLTTIVSGGVPVELPLTSDSRFDLAAIQSRITPRTKLIFICNPNNPTGTMLQSDDIEDFLKTLPPQVLVVLDEAYIDFVAAPGQTGIDFVKAGYPVISVRTFSKMYGLAGLRIGYAVAQPEILLPMHTVREPYAANRIALAGALAALDDTDFVARVRKENTQGMAYLAKETEAMGLDMVPSSANFALVNLHRDANTVFSELRQRGILIRPGATWGLPTCVRITIGTAAQLQVLVENLKSVLDEV
jgi:histidinol-phosphate aminotransferase